MQCTNLRQFLRQRCAKHYTESGCSDTRKRAHEAVPAATLGVRLKRLLESPRKIYIWHLIYLLMIPQRTPRTAAKQDARTCWKVRRGRTPLVSPFPALFISYIYTTYQPVGRANEASQPRRLGPRVNHRLHGRSVGGKVDVVVVP